MLFNKKNCLLFLAYCFVCISCIKAPVEFIDNSTQGDPNISFIDNYPVNLATYKLDSFVTSAHSVFALGYHRDISFGRLQSSVFVQLGLPADNPVKQSRASFDSIVLILKPNGNYYGDSTFPSSLNIYRLEEKIRNDDDGQVSFFNPGQFKYESLPLGNWVGTVKPRKGTPISIRLDNGFGQALLSKLKENSTDIQDNESFVRYFRGLYLAADTSVVNNVFYFKADSSSNLLRLYYHLNGALPVEKYLDFPFDPSRQFNNIVYDHAGTALAPFSKFKKQLKSTALTGHRAFLHSNMASYVKINFPTLQTLKDLHPYIKVMKAELVIIPNPLSRYYPYELPPTLQLYATDDNNGLNAIVKDPSGQRNQTGDLYIDELYGENTAYTFNITGFVNNVLEEGRFSTAALMLMPGSGVSDASTERLIINDQTFSKGIKLKLYVLGL